MLLIPAALQWLAWLSLAFVTFLSVEAWALLTNHKTLSRTIWRLQAQYPIVACLSGAVIGGLTVHFFGFIPACNP